ncbi:unnamed protein product [Diplocarpon coronariae]|nr:hypothetical protein JHW43_003672 [Diplocarpon mali]
MCGASTASPGPSISTTSTSTSTSVSVSRLHLHPSSAPPATFALASHQSLAGMTRRRAGASRVSAPINTTIKVLQVPSVPSPAATRDGKIPES